MSGATQTMMSSTQLRDVCHSIAKIAGNGKRKSPKTVLATETLSIFSADGALIAIMSNDVKPAPTHLMLSIVNTSKKPRRNWESRTIVSREGILDHHEYVQVVLISVDKRTLNWLIEGFRRRTHSIFGFCTIVDSQRRKRMC